MQLVPFDQCDRLQVSADIHRRGSEVEFVYDISGDTSDVIIPPTLPSKRCDGLWQGTCFEAFVAIDNASYIELNFAPSGQWAAYHFTNYREGMADLDIAQPRIFFESNRLEASVQIDLLAGAKFNLAAVIALKSGIRTYWALSHPGGNRPDFHARDCFVAKLA